MATVNKSREFIPSLTKRVHEVMFAHLPLNEKRFIVAHIVKMYGQQELPIYGVAVNNDYFQEGQLTPDWIEEHFTTRQGTRVHVGMLTRDLSVTKADIERARARSEQADQIAITAALQMARSRRRGIVT